MIGLSPIGKSLKASDAYAVRSNPLEGKKESPRIEVYDNAPRVLEIGSPPCFPRCGVAPRRSYKGNAGMGVVVGKIDLGKTQELVGRYLVQESVISLFTTTFFTHKVLKGKEHFATKSVEEGRVYAVPLSGVCM